jgi:hypothetical protein
MGMRSEAIHTGEGCDKKCRSFARISRSFARMDRSFARMDRLFARMDRSFARMDRSFARMDRSFARMDRSFARMDRSFARIDRLFARMDRPFAPMDGSSARMDDGNARMDRSFAPINHRPAPMRKAGNPPAGAPLGVEAMAATVARPHSGQVDRRGPAASAVAYALAGWTPVPSMRVGYRAYGRAIPLVVNSVRIARIAAVSRPRRRAAFTSSVPPSSARSQVRLSCAREEHVSVCRRSWRWSR